MVADDHAGGANCMSRLTIRIDPPYTERLIALAVRERRTPRDQAAVLVQRALTGPQPTEEAHDARTD
jgi:hypothetical protein